MSKQVKSRERVSGHGEVFTNEREVKSMCDLVNEQTERIDSRFLEPACGDGNFLIEILKRKIEMVKKKYEISSYDYERFSLLALSSLYGVELLADNVNLCRKRLLDYWEKEYKKVCPRDYDERTVQSAKFILNKNIVCGNALTLMCVDENGKDTQKPIVFSEWSFPANDARMQRKDYTLDNLVNGNKDGQASIIENEEGKFLKQYITHYNMKFDVIIGNPPYQLSDGGGTGDSAKPIYQLFINQAKKLNPKYISMIVPSRWMKGGKGLDNFRKEMAEDTRLRYIYDFEDAKECFPGIHIDGGVNYFLWDKSYDGKCEYHYKSLKGEENSCLRFLKNDVSDTVIRDYNQITIIEKAASLKEEKFSKICSARNPFGYFSDIFNNPEKYSEANLSFEEDKNKYKVYGVKGKKGGAKRVIGYVDKNSVERANDDVNKYKLYFSKAYMTTSTVPPEIIIGEPGTVCTETFLKIGSFETKEQAMNCLSYVKTKFFRALLFYNRHSLNISRESFKLIPIQNFNEEWTDEKLYKKYNLTEKEIKFIEENILPMGDGKRGRLRTRGGQGDGSAFRKPRLSNMTLLN